MIYTISSELLKVQICDHGAELKSVQRTDSDFEYMWQADATYWNRTSPVLFPMVGKVWNGEFRMDGEILPMGQHGFVRDMDFEVVLQTENSIIFQVQSTDETYKNFPRHFALRISYIIDKNVLYIFWQVRNTGRKSLPFQIGAHPAFNYKNWNCEDPVYGYFSFNETSKLVSTAITSSGYRCKSNETFDVVLKDGLLPLTATTFGCDTIIDARNKVNAVTLHDKEKRPMLTVKFDMPIVALWSPNGGKSPFVCIEPWCGNCDIEGYEGAYEDRDIINSLLPGEMFTNTYSIEYHK